MRGRIGTLVLASALLLGCGTDGDGDGDGEHPPAEPRCTRWALGPELEVERGPLVCRIDAAMHGSGTQVALAWERWSCDEIAPAETHVALVARAPSPALETIVSVPGIFSLRSDPEGYLTWRAGVIETRDARFEPTGTLTEPPGGIAEWSATNPEVVLSPFREPELGGFVAFHLRRQEQIGAVRFTRLVLAMDFLADGTFLAVGNADVHRIRRGGALETADRLVISANRFGADRAHPAIFSAGDTTIERIDARAVPLHSERFADLEAPPVTPDLPTTDHELLTVLADGTLRILPLEGGTPHVLSLGPAPVRDARIVLDGEGDGAVAHHVHDPATRESVLTLRALTCEARAE